ncbi:hypothetical protein AWC19_11140 [Mycobacterium palustre]|uniref:Uncharacterized protein n=1 Tax=Mycobacterium palustre TaxID=153971 RepID=A0A1X1ZJW7_9MYCO|nr:hypothetical protein AWC19_11140 [Mycobacterium palustre]
MPAGRYRSCTRTEPATTVDGHPFARAQFATAVHSVDDTRDSEFAGNDGAVGQRPADVDHDGRGD